jgi:xanthosine utilization system XapX-like protein
MFARPPAIATLGVLGVLFGDRIPPPIGLLTPKVGSLVARLDRPWGPERRL